MTFLGTAGRTPRKVPAPHVPAMSPGGGIVATVTRRDITATSRRDAMLRCALATLLVQVDVALRSRDGCLSAARGGPRQVVEVTALLSDTAGRNRIRPLTVWVSYRNHNARSSHFSPAIGSCSAFRMTRETVRDWNASRDAPILSTMDETPHRTDAPAGWLEALADSEAELAWPPGKAFQAKLSVSVCWTVSPGLRLGKPLRGSAKLPSAVDRLHAGGDASG
jgi:hypothetical protein